MRTIMITGATRGFGLAIAQALAREEDVSLILAVRDVAAGERVAASLPRPARVVTLDVGSLAAVRRFTDGFREPLTALVNNAGLQCMGPSTFTDEGIETTLAVNHLGPLALTLGLLPWLEGGRVLGVGSGTHNPEHRGATRWGFRGGRYTTVDALARGEHDAPDDVQRGKDAYATSKLLSTVTTMALAKRYPSTAFATMDPGLMPGTGLARMAPWYARLVWSTVMRWLVPLLDDASTPARSAEAVRRLMRAPTWVPGEVYGSDGTPSRRVWAPAREPALGARVLDESLVLLARHGAIAPGVIGTA